MELFESLVRKALNEGFENGKLYVYHMTKPTAIEGGILVGGFERWFSGDNSNYYGPGIYTCMYPAVDKRSRTSGVYFDMNRGSIYGSAMLKLEANPDLSNFVIYDVDTAKRVYGDKWKMEDQLEMILPSRVVEKMKNTRHSSGSLWGYCTNHPDMYTRGTSLKALWEYVLKGDAEANAAVKGLVYWGPGDGFVVIFRDYMACKPVAVSYDYGRTFQPIQVSPKFKAYSQNNVDIWRALKYDAGNPNDSRGLFYDPKTYRKKWGADAEYDYLPPYFYNNFAMVKKNGKSNYLWKKTFLNGPISGVWFDECPERFKRSGTEVIIDGIPVLIKQAENGQFFTYIPRYAENNENEIFICGLPFYNEEKYKKALEKYMENAKTWDKEPVDDVVDDEGDDNETALELSDDDFSF